MLKIDEVVSLILRRFIWSCQYILVFIILFTSPWDFVINRSITYIYYRGVISLSIFSFQENLTFRSIFCLNTFYCFVFMVWNLSSRKIKFLIYIYSRLLKMCNFRGILHCHWQRIRRLTAKSHHSLLQEGILLYHYSCKNTPDVSQLVTTWYLNTQWKN